MVKLRSFRPENLNFFTMELKLMITTQSELNVAITSGNMRNLHIHKAYLLTIDGSKVSLDDMLTWKWTDCISVCFKKFNNIEWTIDTSFSHLYYFEECNRSKINMTFSGSKYIHKMYFVSCDGLTFSNKNVHDMVKIFDCKNCVFEITQLEKVIELKASIINCYHQKIGTTCDNKILNIYPDSEINMKGGEIKAILDAIDNDFD